MGSLTTALPDASATVKGKVQLDSAINSTSTIKAGTPSAVKAAYDLANTANGAAAAAQSTANTAVANAATAQSTADGKVGKDSGAGGVGTFQLVAANANIAIANGSTYAGSGLYPFVMDSDGSTLTPHQGAALSGSWRAFGGYSPSVGRYVVFMAQRIA